MDISKITNNYTQQGSSSSSSNNSSNNNNNNNNNNSSNNNTNFSGTHLTPNANIHTNQILRVPSGEQMASQSRNFSPVAGQSSLSRTPLPGNLILVTKTVFQGHPTVQSPAIQQPVNITYPKTEVVGHGSFGVVFVTTIQETQEKVAIKKVLQDKRFKNRELEIMQKIQHINIVDLRYYYYEEDPQSDSLYLNLILEFMSQSLYQRIRHYVHLQTTMPHDEVQIYMYQLFKGLNYIHGTLGICHRDIKPQNILINPENFQLKICDFGSAKRLNPMEPNVSYICSRYYRAPELIFGSTNYTTKIDVWSSACVMCELILGQPIFPGESGIDQLVEIIKILGTPNKQDICSMNPNYMEHKFPHIKPIPLIKIFKREKDYLCIELISNMLKYDPFERFSALQCLCSSYFDKIRMNYNNEIVTNLKLLDFNNDTDFDYLSQDEKLIVKQKLLPHLYSSINPSG